MWTQLSSRSTATHFFSQLGHTHTRRHTVTSWHCSPAENPLKEGGHSLSYHLWEENLADRQVSRCRNLSRTTPGSVSHFSPTFKMTLGVILPPRGPPRTACNCKGDTLIDYKLFSVADLDITSPLPDYIDMCFYYLLICASRNNSFLLFYCKQHCKVSELNHNYLPMQFMHLCPWGIWWREFTGTSGYFSPTVSCYWYAFV